LAIPRPVRTWATLGIEGRAPYQFEVQAAAFLSDKGQLATRIEGAYNQRITRRLILQPRAELDLSAQDMPDQRIGSAGDNQHNGKRCTHRNSGGLDSIGNTDNMPGTHGMNHSGAMGSDHMMSGDQQWAAIT
jgi:uncharacterized protein involved in copper resistance